jgi:hypothetical protein
MCGWKHGGIEACTEVNDGFKRWMHTIDVNDGCKTMDVIIIFVFFQ